MLKLLKRFAREKRYLSNGDKHWSYSYSA